MYHRQRKNKQRIRTKLSAFMMLFVFIIVFIWTKFFKKTTALYRAVTLFYKHLAGFGRPANLVACLAGPSGKSRCK